MLPVERKRKIINYITNDQSVKVIDLSKEFGVTEETVRRDLEKLEKEGILKRTYGGAIPIKSDSEDELFSVRSRKNIDIKQRLGRAVSDLINDDEIIMMDSSTTSLEIAKSIGNTKDITITTNSMSLVKEMVEYDNIQIICVGGVLRKNALSFIGPRAKKNIRDYYADKVILSCKGIDMERGIMESNEMEAEIKKEMVDASKTVILAIDHTKFDKCSVISLYDFNNVDIIVTDKTPSKKWTDFFDKNNIKCIVA